MGAKEMSFTVFLIHQLAEAWNKTPAEVYAVLESTDILHSYIVPCYDTLHTMGSQYLVNDITSFAIEKGAAL